MEIYEIILILLGIIAVIFIAIYNRLISLKNHSKNAFAQIDVQLKRRNDLIPNLVETVKGYMKYEKSVLLEITKARSAVMGAKSVSQKANASNDLSNAIKSFFAVAENYPKLKASENFMQLQEEITGTENKIAYSRQYYNDVTTEYNNKVETFPSNIIAQLFKFGRIEVFKAAESEKKNVKVSME